MCPLFKWICSKVIQTYFFGTGSFFWGGGGSIKTKKTKGPWGKEKNKKKKTKNWKHSFI